MVVAHLSEGECRREEKWQDTQVQFAGYAAAAAKNSFLREAGVLHPSAAWRNGLNHRVYRRGGDRRFPIADYNFAKSKKRDVAMESWKGSSEKLLPRQGGKPVLPGIICWYCWKDDLIT